MKKVDLIGSRFGKILVLSRAESYFDGRRKRTMWLCKCDCGKERVFRGEDLRSGDTKSCGCLKVYLLEINLTRSRFGKLIVIKKGKKRGKSSSTFWECKCDCGNVIVASSQHLRENMVRSCGCLLDRTPEEELSISTKFFFDHVIKSDGCWEWIGCKVLGYGVLQYKKEVIKAHRFSYLIANGTLDDKKMICHKCDNKGCVNPDHLYQGTSKDNGRDASDRGLLPRGEKCKSSKLSEKDVLEILKSKESTAVLMERFNVSRNTIFRIKNKLSWKHLST